MHGSRLCSAISCARRCFLTVIGKYAPPLTVASLATTTTSRPCTRPIAGDDARRPARRRRRGRARPAARARATARRGSSSRCDALAREQLAARAWRSAARGAAARAGALELRARGRRAARGARPRWPRTSCRSGAPSRAEHDAHRAPARRVPVDRPGDERVRAQRAAEHALRPRARRRAARRGRSPVSMPISCSIADEVLGRDVAGRARRHRAAAELADARLERRAAGLQRGEHVREALPARVVEVRGELRRRRRAPRARPRSARATCTRVGHPGRVAEGDLLRAGVGEPRARCRARARASTAPS